MSRQDKTALTVFAAGAALVVTLFGAMGFDIVRTEIRQGHERQSVRNALAGDCHGATREAFKAGRIPYDAMLHCPALRGDR